MSTRQFMDEDFLLYSKPACRLYHEYAKDMPIFDYHCHLPVEQIAENKQFKNMTQIWLYGDHYKWRGMRTHGVDERYITGNAHDYEKFEAWAAVVPYTIRNPLYHWTHMELKNPFGITEFLNPETAKDIYDRCTDMLQTEEFRARALMKRNRVRVVCTTDDPVDSLEHHTKIHEQGFEIKVLPAFRPDRALAVESPEAFSAWVDKLEQSADMEIRDYSCFLEAIKKRHEFFHEIGCRISDHGIDQPYAEEYTDKEISVIFDMVRCGRQPDAEEILKFKSALLFELAVMDAEKDWTQQFHFGALRANNSRMLDTIGPDTGFDSIGDFEIAKPLVRLLNRLDSKGKLARTILYVLNPRDNDMIAAIIGSFQDSSVPGKIQFGSGWWFNDQKNGMERQMNALSNMGLLSCFVGMLTDSRSFLSYSRHEYFRRVLCNLIGRDVDNGELPDDMEHLGKIVRDICYYNALNYFGIGVE